MLYANFEELKNGDVALKPLSQGTDEQIVAECNRLLGAYLTGYRALKLFDRWKEAETYIEGQHWGLVAKEDPNEPQPNTPVLWSTRANLHADLVAMYPRANPQPESIADDKSVEMITKIINSAWERRGQRSIWREITRGVLDFGLVFEETFWDQTLYNGVGDVNYAYWSCRKLVFDPYVSDIQQSEAVFKLNFERQRSVVGKYPDQRDKIQSGNIFSINPSDFSGGVDGKEPVDPTDLVLIVDFYWREWVKTGEDKGYFTLHWRKIACGAILERPADATRSVYAHGKYPFTPFCYERKEGTLFCQGLVDRMKKLQWYIDKMDQCVLKNMMVGARNKMLVNRNARVDMQALKNWQEDVIEADGIGEDDVKWFDVPQFAAGQFQYSMQKIEVMKDESGENLFAIGQGGRGITAAQAVFALQEKGAKRSTTTGNGLFDPMCEVALQTAELMAEFYTEPRIVAITDDDGNTSDEAVEAKTFKVAGKDRMVDMHMTMSVEINPGYVSGQKNTTAAQLLQTGQISPSIAFAMMEFPGKEEVAALVKKEQEGQMAQLVQQNKMLMAQLSQVQGSQAQQGQPGNFRPPMMPQAAGK